MPVTIQLASSSMMSSRVHLARLPPPPPEAGAARGPPWTTGPRISIVAVELALAANDGEDAPRPGSEAARTFADPSRPLAAGGVDSVRAAAIVVARTAVSARRCCARS